MVVRCSVCVVGCLLLVVSYLTFVVAVLRVVASSCVSLLSVSVVCVHVTVGPGVRL